MTQTTKTELEKILTELVIETGKLERDTFEAISISFPLLDEAKTQILALIEQECLRAREETVKELGEFCGKYGFKQGVRAFMVAQLKDKDVVGTGVWRVKDKEAK